MIPQLIAIVASGIVCGVTAYWSYRVGRRDGHAAGVGEGARAVMRSLPVGWLPTITGNFVEACDCTDCVAARTKRDGRLS